jgi:hypothetical protein
MKSTFLSLLALAAMALLAPIQAADDALVAKLTAVDDERVAAMKSADAAKLAAIFSDEMHYAHSSGVVDSKSVLIDNLAAKRTKYLSYKYEDRKFTFPAPGIALMTGRNAIQVEGSAGKVDLSLSFLAVWREEQGQWRFLAWQSCKVAPAATGTRPGATKP